MAGYRGLPRLHRKPCKHEDHKNQDAHEQDTAQSLAAFRFCAPQWFHVAMDAVNCSSVVIVPVLVRSRFQTYCPHHTRPDIRGSYSTEIKTGAHTVGLRLSSSRVFLIGASAMASREHNVQQLPASADCTAMEENYTVSFVGRRGPTYQYQSDVAQRTGDLHPLRMSTCHDSVYLLATAFSEGSCDVSQPPPIASMSSTLLVIC
jgi:hypothetical protein